MEPNYLTRVVLTLRDGTMVDRYFSDRYLAEVFVHLIPFDQVYGPYDTPSRAIQSARIEDGVIGAN